MHVLRPGKTRLGPAGLVRACRGEEERQAGRFQARRPAFFICFLLELQEPSRTWGKQLIFRKCFKSSTSICRHEEKSFLAQSRGCQHPQGREWEEGATWSRLATWGLWLRMLSCYCSATGKQASDLSRIPTPQQGGAPGREGALAQTPSPHSRAHRASSACVMLAQPMVDTNRQLPFLTCRAIRGSGYPSHLRGEKFYDSISFNLQ